VPRSQDERALIEKYGTGAVPRYTSYPTAPHFHAGIGPGDYAAWLAALRPDADLSLYLHIPYCDRLCWFCGCHTKQTLRYEPIAKYLRSLELEIGMVSALVGIRGSVKAIHLGGGSPTMLRPHDLHALMQRLRGSFAVSGEAELSIEIDPSDMDEARLDALAEVGITRASLGVQDFDALVQAAINRLQSYGVTKAVVDGLRRRGVPSLNLDVLYGLPLQTEATLLETIRLVTSLAPERIALFGYAHVPWMKKHQALISTETLPDASERFDQAEAAAAALVAAGYERIGIDHFALPNDGLAIAARAGALRRNFQGYTTDACDALIGLGASSIGRLPQGYVQNIVATNRYEQLVDSGQLATAKGFELARDDEIRAYVIERLMCDFGFSHTDLLARFGRADAAPLIRDARLIAALDTDGVTSADDDAFTVTARGRPFVRAIAAGFDTYLGLGKGKHSVAI
jgi:oxygen-independent coproporphyrinogen III oxidase